MLVLHSMLDVLVHGGWNTAVLLIHKYYTRLGGKAKGMSIGSQAGLKSFSHLQKDCASCCSEMLWCLIGHVTSTLSCSCGMFCDFIMDINRILTTEEESFYLANQSGTK